MKMILTYKKAFEQRKVKKTQVQKTKDMKTCGAISLVVVATAESTAQKCTFSIRNIKVVIENSLSKWITIQY